jgi:hypothetical protein
MAPKATVDRLRTVKRKHAAALLRRPGVCGVDIDDTGAGAITVHLDTRDRRLLRDLPRTLDGVKVEYVYTGPIRKQ